MRYLTIEKIKQQCVIDEQYTDEDSFLESIGNAAEDYVEQMVNQNLDELVAENGQLPPSIEHACLIVVDFLYAVQRGSNANDHSIPECVDKIIKLYRSFV